MMRDVLVIREMGDVNSMWGHIKKSSYPRRFPPLLQQDRATVILNSCLNYIRVRIL
jgi:hypothetical protein